MNDLDEINAKLDTIMEAIEALNTRVALLTTADEATAGLAKLVMDEMFGEEQAINPEPTPKEEPPGFLDWRDADTGNYFEITYDGNGWFRANPEQTVQIRNMIGRRRK